MLSKLFRRRRPVITFDPPRPEQPVEIVGDVHGRADLLRALPEVAPGAVRVLVGDYVDRGPDSREVLELVHARERTGEWICLCGNHEEMFLDFLRDPANGNRWLRFGGLQTLASFGVCRITETAGEAALRDAAATVLNGVSFDLVAWLEGLQSIWSSGTLSVVHAGLDPALPLDVQARSIAIWGHPEFGVFARSDGQWVAHGHTIVDAPTARDGVISIDTGAYATGRLTLARVSTEGNISFVP